MIVSKNGRKEENIGIVTIESFCLFIWLVHFVIVFLL
jgi:hypothetical protein